VIEAGHVVFLVRNKIAHRLIVLSSPTDANDLVVLVLVTEHPRASATSLNLRFQSPETGESHNERVSLLFDEAQEYIAGDVQGWIDDKKRFPNIYLGKRRVAEESMAILLNAAEESGMPEDLKGLLG